MAGYSRAAALKRALEVIGLVQPAPPPIPLDAFTNADWAHAQVFRESLDRLERAKRWCVTVTPPDRSPRSFIFTGRLESVARRAAHVFPQFPCSVVCEPAPTPNGPESFDRRFNLST